MKIRLTDEEQAQLINIALMGGAPVDSFPERIRTELSGGQPLSIDEAAAYFLYMEGTL